jgi:hypothetical protein
MTAIRAKPLLMVEELSTVYIPLALQAGTLMLLFMTSQTIY